MSMFGMKVAMIFKADGLNEEAVKAEIESRGLTVDEIDDDELVESKEAVRIFYVHGDFGKMIRLKLDYNCWEDLHQKYVWYPMENLTAKDWEKYYEAKKAVRSQMPG